MERVLITGATGFIGSHIARTLIEYDVPIGCLVRKTSDLSNINGLKFEIRYGDIKEKESLIHAFKDFDFIIHNAALVGDWGKYEDFYATNVLGTLNVLEACYQNGIRDIIITGTNSVYGEENNSKIKNECSPINPHYHYFMDTIFPCRLNYYRDTKAIATEKATQFAMKHGMNLTILDPVWVYGEREFHSGFYEYLKTVRDGMIFVPGCKKNRFHVIYARDLAEAYYLAFQKRFQGVHRFIIGNERAEPMHEIYRLLCEEAGFKNPIKLPKCVFYPIGFLMEMLYSAFGSKKPPLLTRGRVNLFYDNIEYSVKKSRNVLGFKNKHSLTQGIKKTVDWYRNRNLL